MKPGMLNSDKTVQTGSRSGEKWVQTNKEGKKYAAVPIENFEIGVLIEKERAGNEETGRTDQTVRIREEES